MTSPAAKITDQIKSHAKNLTFYRRALSGGTAAALLFAGLCISYRTNDWTWLESFGHTMTMVGIASFAFGLESDIRLAGEKRFDQLIEEIRKRDAPTGMARLEKSEDIIVAGIIDHEAVVRPEIIKGHKQFEVGILLLGTAIGAWGGRLHEVVVWIAAGIF